MGLLADFKTAAVARTRFPDDERLTQAAIFALVRDMPFARPSGIQPRTIVTEWQATAPGKHLLLQALYEEFGGGAMLICALHSFRAEELPWLPDELRAHLEAGPIPDVHMFLRLRVDTDWMTIDASWPLAAGQRGLVVNERFETSRDMKVAIEPDEIMHIPPEADPVEFEQLLIERHVGDQLERRNAFLDALSVWLAQAALATG